jgi:hypothetical protein
MKKTFFIFQHKSGEGKSFYRSVSGIFGALLYIFGKAFNRLLMKSMSVNN